MAASRVALELTGMVIPAGFQAIHTCDNPPCCNPKHLRVGTPLDNAKDMVAKKRVAFGDRHSSRVHPERVARGDRHGSKTSPDSIRRGRNHQNAKLTEDAVLKIKEGIVNGEKRKDLAAQFGVKVCTLDKIATNKLWVHVPWPLRQVMALYLQDPQGAPQLGVAQTMGVDFARAGEKVAT